MFPLLPPQLPARPGYSRPVHSPHGILGRRRRHGRVCPMQELKVIGVENGALLAASDDGARFRIEIDEVLQSRNPGRLNPNSTPDPNHPRARSRRSSAPACRCRGRRGHRRRSRVHPPIRRPVLAEREHVVTSALAVPVNATIEGEPADEPTSFGAVLRDRLTKLGAEGERWASWKDGRAAGSSSSSSPPTTIDHDARWSLRTARRTPSQPLNSEAIALSQQGEFKGASSPGCAPSARRRPRRRVAVRQRRVHVPGARAERNRPTPRRTSNPCHMRVRPHTTDAVSPRPPSSAPTSPQQDRRRDRRPARSATPPTRRARGRRRRDRVATCQAARGATAAPVSGATRQEPRPSRGSRSSRAPPKQARGRPGRIWGRRQPARPATAVRSVAGPRCRAGTKSSSAPAPTTIWPDSPAHRLPAC